MARSAELGPVFTPEPTQFQTVGFYVYRGRIRKVCCHAKVARRIERFGDGTPESPYVYLAPAVYRLPMPLGDFNEATYFRHRVEFRDGDFYLRDGRNLRAIARPPEIPALPEVASAPDEEVEIEWLN